MPIRAVPTRDLRSELMSTDCKLSDAIISKIDRKHVPLAKVILSQGVKSLPEIVNVIINRVKLMGINASKNPYRAGGNVSGMYEKNMNLGGGDTLDINL